MQRSLFTSPSTSLPSPPSTPPSSSTQPSHPAPSSSTPSPPLDILIIGAGFAGCYALHISRLANFRTKVLDAGTDLGGVWHFNSYPGARVDSQWPIYALNIPAIYNTWRWTEHYPGHEEIKSYFRYLGSKLDLYKDVEFKQTVTDVIWDEGEKVWTVRSEQGRSWRARYVLACTGFAAKRHFPDWRGLDGFKGQMHHSSFWPKEHVDVRGKKVAVIGTGATGVQIIQEWGREVGEGGSLLVFQRTPMLGFPMCQRSISDEEHVEMGRGLKEVMEGSRWTHTGFAFDTLKDLKTFDHGEEERERFYTKLWEQGGFRFHGMTYSDVLTDDKANDEAYKFWAKKVRERIRDPRKRDLLAPLQKPHVLGGKRPCMEQWYYDIFDQPNVDIVDVNKTPIQEVLPEGIRTEDGVVHELDIICLATGFDSVTGGLNAMNIRGTNGLLLRDKWKQGIWTHLGMTMSSFPNFFTIYGPQAPTSFANGPSAVEPQADWIIQVLQDMRREGLERIEATEEAERRWKELVVDFSARTLRHHVPSGWNGGNIPGKVQEPLSFSGGLPDYRRRIDEERKGGMTGFVMS